MKIILSKDNIEESLSRFMAQYDNILASVKRIGSADLRYPNGFAIKKSTEPNQKIDSGERPLIWLNKKKKKILIVGLDIGTSKIVAIVAELQPDGLLNVIGLGQHSSKGLKKV